MLGPLTDELPRGLGRRDGKNFEITHCAQMHCGMKLVHLRTSRTAELIYNVYIAVVCLCKLLS